MDQTFGEPRDDDERDAGHDRGPPRRYRRALPRLQLGGQARAVLGEQQKDHEQHDDRQRVVDALHHDRNAVQLGQAPIEVVEGKAENHRAQCGERQAAQSTDDGNRVRVDHQQGEARNVERKDRSQQHTGQGRQHRAHDPTCDRGNVGAVTVEPGEIPVVDHGSHRDAEARPVEQHP